MELEHQFSVPVPIETAWAVLLDLDQVAPCFPGATLTSHDDAEFAGTVKVKLGPITLLYKGSGKFSERDEAAHRVVVEASGKDARGAGTAAAKVTATLDAAGRTTTVTVVSDLKITGRPAQLSRGLISEVGGKLVQQFADCLAQRLGSDATTGPATSTRAASSASGAPGTSAGTGSAAAASGSTGATSATGATTERAATGGSYGADQASTGSGRHASAPRLAEAPPESEPIDLLGAARGPVLKRILPIVGAVAVVIIAIVIVRHFA